MSKKLEPQDRETSAARSCSIYQDDISMNKELSVFQYNKGDGCLSSQSETGQKRKSLNAKFKKARLRDGKGLATFIILTSPIGFLFGDEHRA